MKGSQDKNLSEKKIEKALIKKALGYDSTEVVEEYVTGEEGEIKLTKKKVTKKNVPPDITAIKMLMEDDSEKDVFTMSDEELIAERNRLLNLLKEIQDEKGEKGEKRKN
jgi:hypothetical protein